jgi:hypothetical protein
VRDDEANVAMPVGESGSPIRSAATRLSQWIFGAGEPEAAGYYVCGASWPAGARDSDLSIPKLYDVLNEAFDNYFDSAMASLAKVQPPDEKGNTDQTVAVSPPKIN